MIILISEVHPEKVERFIVVIPSGMVICLRDLQLLKAFSPILVTLLGIFILTRLEHPPNAPLSKLVTEDSTIKSTF